MSKDKDTNDEELKVEKDQPKVWLDSRFFVTADPHCFRLGWVVENEETGKISERGGGYYATMRQVLDTYVNKVLRGNPTREMQQLLDLYQQIADAITRISPAVNVTLDKKSYPTPEVNASLVRVGDRQRMRSPGFAVDLSPIKLKPSERENIQNVCGVEFGSKEIAPGLLWNHVPDIFALHIVRACLALPNTCAYAQPIYDRIKILIRDLRSPTKPVKSAPRAPKPEAL